MGLLLFPNQPEKGNYPPPKHKPKQECLKMGGRPTFGWCRKRHEKEATLKHSGVPVETTRFWATSGSLILRAHSKEGKRNQWVPPLKAKGPLAMLNPDYSTWPKALKSSSARATSTRAWPVAHSTSLQGAPNKSEDCSCFFMSRWSHCLQVGL